MRVHAFRRGAGNGGPHLDAPSFKVPCEARPFASRSASSCVHSGHVARTHVLQFHTSLLTLLRHCNQVAPERFRGARGVLTTCTVERS